MKVLYLLAAPLLACSVLAQRSFITFPADGSTVVAGRRTVVQVTRPNSLQGSVEVGLVIGLQVCQSGTCAPPNQQIGTVLFNGQYSPKLHEQPGRPYQNFTVTIPSSFPKGKAQLATARLHLIGAGPSPTLELNNITLTVT